MKYYRETKDGVLTGLVSTDGVPESQDYAYEEISESAYLTQREQMLALSEGWSPPSESDQVMELLQILISGDTGETEEPA